MNPDLLFVYGSLRVGEVNFPVTARAGARLIGAAETLRSFPLEEGPRWKRLLDRPGAGARIRGELFVVSDEAGWASLDAFEGHPWMYRRRVEPVVDGTGRARPAWIYFYVEP